MKKISLVFIIFTFALFFLNAQKLERVSYIKSGSKITLHYSMSNIKDDERYDVRISYSKDFGKTFNLISKNITNTGIALPLKNGTNKSVWDIQADSIRFYKSKIFFEIDVNISILPEMVFVEGGEFMMGNDTPDINSFAKSYEYPLHKVTIPDFYMGKYEITQEQWTQIMGSNPSSFKGCLNCPVETITWHEIQEFITRLNTQTGENYYLPSEAEWEYAANGGNVSKSYMLSGSNAINKIGIVNVGETQAVGLKHPNELGIYDMSGNVWEFCQDQWNPSYSGAPTDGSAWETNKDDRRVIRGGSYAMIPSKEFIITTTRIWYAEKGKSKAIGFRVALKVK